MEFDLSFRRSWKELKGSPGHPFDVSSPLTLTGGGQSKLYSLLLGEIAHPVARLAVVTCLLRSNVKEVLSIKSWEAGLQALNPIQV